MVRLPLRVVSHLASEQRAMECAFIPSIKNKSGRMDEFFVSLVSATKRGWVLGWRDAEPYIYIYIWLAGGLESVYTIEMCLCIGLMVGHTHSKILANTHSQY